MAATWNRNRPTIDPDDIAVQVARSLATVRREKHITQQQLAENTGIAQADISRLENGNSNPGLRTLDRIAQGLGCTLEIAFVDKDTDEVEEAAELEPQELDL